MDSRIEALQEQQGWDQDTMLDLALVYISRQGDDDAFVDYCQQAADDENSFEEET